jgi:transcriptional regulator with XRE-family HTH domain
MAPPSDDTVLSHTDGESFGQLITRCRSRLGLSQRELADQVCAALGRATVTRHELSRYERDVRLPRYSTLEALAVSLNIPLSELQLAIARQAFTRQT